MTTDPNRLTGIIELEINGNVTMLNGEGISFNLGLEKKEGKVSASGVTGYTTTAQVPFIAGTFTLKSGGIKMKDTISTTNVLVTANLNNGMNLKFSDCWFAEEGTAETTESTLPFRFESMKEGEIF